VEGSTHPTPVCTLRYLPFWAPLQAILYQSPPLSMKEKKEKDTKLFTPHSLLYHHDADGGVRLIIIIQ